MPTGLGSCPTFLCSHPKFQIYFICETVEDSHVRLQFKPFAMILIRTKSGLASPMPELPPATPAILPSTIDIVHSSFSYGLNPLNTATRHSHRSAYSYSAE